MYVDTKILSKAQLVFLSRKIKCEFVIKFECVIKMH